jgi:hypothetical protein
MKKSCVIIISICAIFSFLLISCGTSKVLLTVKRPAEINLKNFKKIAIGNITGGNGNHATDVSDGITSRLVQANTFEVLDRQNLQKILDEHKLNMTGVVDQNSVAELGKIIGSAALVFGRIQTDNYKEEIKRDKPWRDKDGGYHQYIYRNGKYDFTVHLQIVDIQTAKILGSKDMPVSITESTSADNSEPEAINVDNLYSSALQSICNGFMRVVASYDVQVSAEFETDDKLPEVENAVNQFKIGETNEAVKILEGAAKRDFAEPKIKAKAVYNLGLAQMYSGVYDEAAENFKKAYSLNACTRYQEVIQQCKNEKAQADKLKSQQ